MPGPHERVTDRVASYILESQNRNLPDDILEKAKLCVLDAVGCAVFGSSVDWAISVRRLCEGWGGKPESAIWTSGTKVPAPLASLANSIAVNSFELDDSHTKAVVHPGCVVVPSAFSVAEACGISSPELLLSAIVTGYETLIRVGTALGRGPMLVGRYNPSICGVFGSVAAASSLMRLDRRQIKSALHIASSLSAGLWSPTPVKRFATASSAQMGLVSCLAAQQGLQGIEDAFEAGHGGFFAAFGSDKSLDDFALSIDSPYALPQVSFKPYSCSRPTFTTLDALERLTKSHHLDVDSIEKVTILTSTSTKNSGQNKDVNDLAAALVSIPYCGAVYLLDRSAFVEQFTEERVFDSKVRSLMSRFEVKAKSEYDLMPVEDRYIAEVELTLRDGTTLSETATRPKGDLGNPMSKHELHNKFLYLARRRLPEERAQRLCRSLEGICDSDLLELYALLGAPS